MTKALTLAAAAAALVCALSAGAAAAAITVQTTDFITVPTYFNGFENRPSFSNSWTEDGIAVTYVGGGSRNTQIVDFRPPQGVHDWYENGGGDGYTDIRILGDDAFSQIQFLVSSGASPLFSSQLDYTLLLGGVVVQSGVAGSVPSYVNGFVYYGFSGGLFDEVRLSVVFPSIGVTPPTGGQYDGGIYDSFAVAGVVKVPEPGTWVMLTGGLLGLGGLLRARRSGRLQAA